MSRYQNDSDTTGIRRLQRGELTEMYITFTEAFSDYPVPFKLTKEQFAQKFVQKLKIDFSLSVGVFDETERLVGFVFTTTHDYGGKRTAYNGGTGVIPLHRGNQLTMKMYQFLMPLFRQHEVEQCVLEVLTTNKKAINVYQQIGFEKTKYFRCFVSKKLIYPPIEGKEKIDLVIRTTEKPNWAHYQRFWDGAPSFLDSSSMIQANLSNETIIEAVVEGQCVGVLVYQPALGRVSQLSVAPTMRRKGIGSALMRYMHNDSHQKKITVINVNDELHQVKSFFEALGFENQIDQYEMTLPL